MLRMFSILVCAVALFGALPAFADTPVSLRARIEATGPAVTLGDVFDGAGDVAGRTIAPAPAAGQVSTLSTEFLVAAANSAGLTWTPPAGVDAVRVTHPAGARAFVGASPAQQAQGQSAAPTEVAIHRGETVLLSFEAPGMQISTHARALADGTVGQTLRFTNLTSNRIVEATITGPGAARIDTP